MLEASPVEISLNLDDVAAAIDACLTCEQTCTSCADSDLAEKDVAEMSRCIALCVECAEVCGLVARSLSRPARWDPPVIHRLLQACVGTCTNSADECARHAEHHRHCAICAQACRACLRACSNLLEDEAFEELQKLAGG
jgi:uncharacterized membrane protein